MASFDEHMSQATHNEETANYLLYPGCLSASWVNVISFYTALQYMEAAFANTEVKHLSDYYSQLRKDGINPGSLHDVMQKIIYENPDFRVFYSEYRDLRTASEAARYLKHNYEYYNNDRVARINYEDSLDKIKRQLKSKKYI